jgi:predicted Zn-dependent protease
MGRHLLAALLAVCAAACATSPTGRRQLHLLSDDELGKLGAQAYAEMRQTTPVSKDAAASGYVECVARAVLAAAAREDGPPSWEVSVFEDATPNAFALPGGKIGVHTGMLEVAASEGQLAAVLGHEIAHVLARHPNERASQQLATQGALTVAGAAAGEGNAALLAILGAGAKVGVLLPFSRTQEREADLLGLDYMARAGFDPRESIQLWKNMERAGGGGTPQFLSTHPSGRTRIEDLSGAMSSALVLFEEARAAGRMPGCGPRAAR